MQVCIESLFVLSISVHIAVAITVWYVLQASQNSSFICDCPSPMHALCILVQCNVQ